MGVATPGHQLSQRDPQRPVGGTWRPSGFGALTARQVIPCRRLSAARALGCLKPVPGILGGGLVQDACLAQHGWKTARLFQPASRFWTFQAMESAVFIGLAAALVVWTFHIVLARDA